MHHLAVTVAKGEPHHGGARKKMRDAARAAATAKDREKEKAMRSENGVTAHYGSN